jgi:Bacterial Ig-like domain (group 2)
MHSARWGRVAVHRLAEVLIARAAMAAVALGTLCSCSSSTETQTHSVARVAITPATLDLKVGESSQLSAQPQEASGASLSEAVAWQARSASVATVTSTGLVSAVASGATYVIATAGNHADSAKVTVTNWPVIALSPTAVPFTARQGGSDPAAQTVVITNSSDNVLSGLSAAAPATWLQLTFVGGSTTANPSATLQVQPRLAGLTPGLYSTVVTVSSTLPNVAAKTFTVSLNLAPPLAAATVEALSLLTQSASAGTSVGQSPSVIVRASDGTPVAGVSIAFAVTAGGGSIQPTSPVSTNANGIATLTSWTLGPVAGVPQAVVATATGLVGSPITFRASTIGPSKIELVSGSGQTGVEGNPLGSRVTVRVSDVNGRPVSNWGVSFIASNGGSASPAAATTDATGLASATWTLGTSPGAQTLTAAVNTEVGQQSVDATATATGVVQLVKLGGDGQSGVVGSQLPSAISVRVLGANNTPIPGAAVAFTGDGTVSATPVTTDAQGEARTFWTLPTSQGSKAMNATAGGISVAFAATANAAGAGSIVVLSGNNQSNGRGCTALPSPVVVRVTDGFGNPASGIDVAFTPSAGNGSSFSPSSIKTDADGKAQSVWTLGSNLGHYTANVTAGALTPIPIAADETLLCPNLGAFKGIITKVDGGTSSPNSGNVSFTPKGSSNPLGTVDAGNDGVFQTPTIPAGTYVLEATSRLGGFTIARRYEQNLAGGTVVDLGPFKVTQNGITNLTINVTFAGGDVTSQVALKVERWNDENADLAGLTPFATSDETVDLSSDNPHTVNFSSVSRGYATLRISAPGYKTTRTVIFLDDSQNGNTFVRVDVVLQPGN